VKKRSPVYYVYGRSNVEVKKPVLSERNAMSDIVGKLKPILEQINREEIDYPENMPLFSWNIYKNNGKGGWGQTLEKAPTRLKALTSALDKTDLAEVGSYALFAYLFKDATSCAILLLGRRLLHPEKPDYSAFNREQQETLSIFINILEGWLKYEEYYQQASVDAIIGESVVAKSLKEQISVAARLPWPVLLIGETGSGKELTARAIHQASPRKDGPFVSVNCGGMPDSLVESELFGYVKGAFTDALKEGKKGKFEQADKGTIFLDEINRASYKLQTALLRVLATQHIVKIGSNQELPVDVRVVCASNETLYELKKTDLVNMAFISRIRSLIIHVPPLRNRKDDVAPLTRHFMNQFNQEIYAFRQEKTDISITDRAIERLKLLDFKEGNVRELRNILQMAIMASKLIKGAIEARHIEAALQANDIKDDAEQMKISQLDCLETDCLSYFQRTLGLKDCQKLRLMGIEPSQLEEKEKTCYEKLLKEYKNSNALAKQIGITPESLCAKLKKYEIDYCKLKRLEKPTL
jgi:transcriptional regulator with PAS, ATPase and Fis domain